MQDIRVVITDDISQTRENVRMLLELEKNIKVVGEAGNGDEALELVRVTNPDVVLMDVNMPIMDGIRATELLSVHFPQVAVIIISVQGEQEYMKKAMMAGAKEYITKPFTADELTSTIKRVVELERKRKVNVAVPGPSEVKKHQPQLITVFGTKGGVGKTSIAVNLAIALSHKSRERVALVDLDLQAGDVSVMMNIYPKRTIAELVQEKTELDMELLETYLCERNGVKILSAPNKPELAETVNEDNVARLLKALIGSYDYVVVDTASFFNDVTLVALDMADCIFMVTTPDLPALKNNKRALDVLKHLSLQAKVKLILNRSATGYGVETEDVERALELGIAATFPSDARLVVTSMNRGLPFILVEPNSTMARSVHNLLPLVSLGEEKQEKTSKARGFFSRGVRGLAMER
ncbi:MAG: AAA family ATPase [Chitinophagales bacterium]